jgi:hypothetical protein
VSKARTVDPPALKQPRYKAILWKSPIVVETNCFLFREQHRQFESEGQVTGGKEDLTLSSPRLQSAYRK